MAKLDSVLPKENAQPVLHLNPDALRITASENSSVYVRQDQCPEGKSSATRIGGRYAGTKSNAHKPVADLAEGDAYLLVHAG